MQTAGIISALRRGRVWLGHAFLVAFVLRALVPAGFMPEFTKSDGSFKIVICTANGSKVIDAGLDDNPHGGTVAKHMGDPCAMSGATALVLPDTAATFALPDLYPATVPAMGSPVTLPPARAGPAHAPRAPPTLA